MLTMFYTICFPAHNKYSEGVCGMFDIFSDKRDSERDRESLQIISIQVSV